MDHLFIGQIVHTKSFNEFEIIVDGFVAVRNGKVSKFSLSLQIYSILILYTLLQIINVGHKNQLELWKDKSWEHLPVTSLTDSQFLLPGFVDCHIHAPQMPNIGLGLDKPLLEWLNEYTFPMEAKYEDTVFAKDVYEKVIVCI